MGTGGAPHQRKANASRLLGWAKGLCAAEAVAGQLLSLAALLYLQGPTAALGLLLGLATTVTACLGVSGCVLRHTGHLAGHIVGGVLLSSLAVGYVAQVDRQARVDCALAELLQIQRRAERAVDALQGSRDTLLSAVQLRLAALDGTLGTLGREHSVHADEAHSRELWRVTDAQYVQRQLVALKAKAMKALERLWEQTTEGGTLKQLQAAVQDRLTEQDKRELDARLTALFTGLSEAVRRLEGHLAGTSPLGPEQFGEVVANAERGMRAVGAFVRELEQVLGRGGTPLTHSQLQELLHGGLSGEPGQGLHDPADVALLREALGRQATAAAAQAGGYLAVPLASAAAAKEAWRSKWDALLASAVAAHGGTEAENAPEQCLREGRGERLLVRVALGLVALQAACTYLTWGAAVQRAQREQVLCE